MIVVPGEGDGAQNLFVHTREDSPPTTRPTGSYTEFTPYRQRPRYYGGQSGARAEQSRDGRTVAQPKHRAGPCRYGTSHHTRYATTVSHHGSHPLVARLTDIWLRLWCGLQCSAPCMPHRTLSHNPSGSQPWTSALPGSASSTLTSTDPSGPDTASGVPMLLLTSGCRRGTRCRLWVPVQLAVTLETTGVRV